MFDQEEKRIRKRGLEITIIPKPFDHVEVTVILYPAEGVNDRFKCDLFKYKFIPKKHFSKVSKPIKLVRYEKFKPVFVKKGMVFVFDTDICSCRVTLKPSLFFDQSFIDRYLFSVKKDRRKYTPINKNGDKVFYQRNNAFKPYRGGTCSS